MRLSSDFSKEIFQVRKDWHKIIKMVKSKDLQPRLLYPAKLSIQIEGEIESLLDNKKLNKFITTKVVL